MDLLKNLATMTLLRASKPPAEVLQHKLSMQDKLSAPIVSQKGIFEYGGTPCAQKIPKILFQE
jgi:hypothetical protein